MTILNFKIKCPIDYAKEMPKKDWLVLYDILPLTSHKLMSLESTTCFCLNRSQPCSPRAMKRSGKTSWVFNQFFYNHINPFSLYFFQDVESNLLTILPLVLTITSKNHTSIMRRKTRKNYSATKASLNITSEHNE